MKTETKTTHTPGPWIDRHFDQDGYVRINSPKWTSSRGADECMIRVAPRYMEIEGRGTSCPPEAVSEAVANARLVAAAPDLLAELKSLLEWIDDARLIASPSLRLAAARAAIAKAEGGAS